MQFKVEAKLLSKSLRLLNPIVEKKNAIPILSNIKIEAMGNTITLSVTDIDLYAVDSLAAEVVTEGSVTLPTHTLFEIIRKLPDTSKITIEYDENKKGKDSGLEVTMTSGTMHCSLPHLPASDFPHFADIKYSNTFSIGTKQLLGLLTTTKYAASNEEVRYYLNGVYLHASKKDDADVLRAVATDLHRIALAEIPAPSGSENMHGVIIPKKTVNELVKLLESDVEEVTISVSPTRILFEIGKIKLSSKLIEGNFPVNYNTVIPSGVDKNFETGVKILADAVDLVTTVSADKTKAVQFNITPSKITLMASSIINGFSRASQDIEGSYNAEPIEISFNSRYILDVLSTISSPLVNLSMKNSKEAIIIKESGQDSAIHILMPMQL